MICLSSGVSMNCSVACDIRSDSDWEAVGQCVVYFEADGRYLSIGDGDHTALHSVIVLA